MPEVPEIVADDHELAATLARGAGRLLLAVAEEGLLSGAALGRAGDALAHAWISRVLAAQRPDDAVLSEEGAADTGRLAHQRVWVVDPLDGTREYAERRTDWAVHICLTVAGVPRAAAVCLPARNVTHSTAAPSEQPPPSSAADGPLRVLVSRSRPPAIATAVARRLDAELHPMGSAGAKAMAVLDGRADAYLHAGGQYEWDSAAPAGVLAAAGLHVSRLDGSALRYNQPDPYLPDLLVCRRGDADRLLSAIAAESVTDPPPERTEHLDTARTDSQEAR